MAASSTSFSSENQPKGRGKSERTKILEALKRAGNTEEGFYDHLLARALDPDDSFALREILNRFSPLKKSVMPDVEFNFNAKGTPVEQVSQLLDAVSTGAIPPDVASMLITSIKGAIEIEINTELKSRIEKLEDMLNA
jgi:hypothetical protein